ncbi:MAG TPA: type II toxin-antitoxin system VapC family toxin [Caulobacteraceae bacterium]|nr:type II toxin-antitoxin system VapC family toxin [Caulobacteraceae bacterium]
MRLLLDTHVALWATTEPERLPAAIAEQIADPGNDVLVSVASLWEIAIKHARGRNPATMPISAADARREFGAAGFTFLDVSASHAIAVESLPSIHGDPFDRLLVAQALTEPLRLVTHDATLAPYSDTLIVF